MGRGSLVRPAHTAHESTKPACKSAWTLGLLTLLPAMDHMNWEEFLYHLAEIQFGGTIILEIAGTGSSASILQPPNAGAST